MTSNTASCQSQITTFEERDGNLKTDVVNHSHVWTVPEVEELLKLYREREAEFKDPTTKKKAIWNEICIEMNNLGFALNPMQCECKLKNMKATYRKILDKAERGINVAGRCPFYDELYEIFGLAPPLRTYPETTNKSRKSAGRKRSIGECDEVAASPAEQVTHLDLSHVQQQQSGLNDNNRNKTLLLEVVEDSAHLDVERRTYPELVEELLTLRRTLEQERHLREEEKKKREEERKKYEDERDRRAKEFHEERMAMLNSMNKLIANLGTKS